jgi:tetratricopeptide (TPR) repeat protein
MVHYFGDWDWKSSEKCFLKALELNPNSATGHQYYAMLLSTQGYNKKALKEAEMAFQLDPLNAPISAMLAYNYINVNMIKEAIEQYEKTLEIDPDFHETWSGQAFVYYKKGDVEKAIKIYEKVIDLPAFRHKSLGGLGYLYAKNGDNNKAEENLKQLEQMETPDLPLDVEKAMIYTGLGYYDRAFVLLNSAIDKKLGGMNFIKSKHWRDLHDDPRYIELLKRMNLPLD